MRKGVGTIVWSLILIGAGSLFLLGNFFPELRPWRLIAHYWSAPWLLFAQFWPVIIIIWGISKLAITFAAIRIRRLAEEVCSAAVMSYCSSSY